MYHFLVNVDRNPIDKKTLEKTTEQILVSMMCWMHKNPQSYPNSRSLTLAKLSAVNTQVQDFFWIHTVNPSLQLYMLY